MYAEIKEESNILKQISYGLRNLSEGFRTVHNPEMASELLWRANTIDDCIENIKNIASKKLDEDVKRAQESSNNMFKGVMTGMEIGRGASKIFDKKVNQKGL
jgi:hypothetical protein